MTRRDWILAAASVVAIPVALLLVVLAIDVAANSGWISEDDSRLRARRSAIRALERLGLLAPLPPEALGVADDFAYAAPSPSSQAAPGEETRA